MLRCGRKSFYQLSVANHWMGCKGNSSFATSLSITTVQLLHLQLIPWLMIQTVLCMKNKWTCQLYFYPSNSCDNPVNKRFRKCPWRLRFHRMGRGLWQTQEHQMKGEIAAKWKGDNKMGGELLPILTEKESSKKRILVSEKLTHTPSMCHYYANSIKIQGNTPLGFYFL